MLRALLFLALCGLVVPALALPLALPAAAQQPLIAPQPPCGEGAAYPPYGDVDGKPLFMAWQAADLQKIGWRPPACLNWQGDSRLVAALAARFHNPGGVDQVAAPIAAVSHYPLIKFWAITKRDWRPIATDAWATDGPQGTQHLPDPPLAQLQPGRDFYYAEDAEMAGRTTYRLRVLQHTADRLVIETENVTPITVAIVTVFEPGALQYATFLDRIDANTWGLYEITRATAASSSMVAGYRSSYLNRLEAIRRLLAGQPTDGAPAIAPW